MRLTLTLETFYVQGLKMIIKIFSFLAASYVTVALLPLFLQGSLQLSQKVNELVTTMNSLEIKYETPKESVKK